MSKFCKGALSILLLSALWGAQIFSVQAADAGKQYGRFLFAEYNVPAATIVEYGNFKPSGPAKGESVITSTMMADTIMWQGPQFKGEPSNSPYTISIEVLGTAKDAGDVSTMWHAGWGIDDKFKGQYQRMALLPGVAKNNVKAGETVLLTGAAAPVRFEEAKDVNAALAFVNARNLNIHSVKVQVWSGIAKTTALETFMAFRWMLVPLVMLGLMWWFKRS